MADSLLQEELHHAVLSDGVQTVDIEKVYTGKGERLKISNDGRSILIDALGLESLSWQDPEDLAESFDVAEGATDWVATEDAENARRRDRFRIMNEFAEAHVSVFEFRSGDALEIEATKIGYSIRLPPRLLAKIAEHDIDLITGFLETPYGPEE